MDDLKKMIFALGRLWAPVLILLVVLACGYMVQAPADQFGVHDALHASLRFGIVN